MQFKNWRKEALRDWDLEKVPRKSECEGITYRVPPCSLVIYSVDHPPPPLLLFSLQVFTICLAVSTWTPHPPKNRFLCLDNGQLTLRRMCQSRRIDFGLMVASTSATTVSLKYYLLFNR